jgi:hypothetical protein
VWFKTTALPDKVIPEALQVGSIVQNNFFEERLLLWQGNSFFSRIRGKDQGFGDNFSGNLESMNMIDSS